MAYGIRIVGLGKVQKALGQDFRPTIKAALKAIALQVEGEVAPYPPATAANSPSNPAGRWYERGYGPKWRVKSGDVHSRKTSQMMNRGWSVKARGSVGWLIGNRATYSGWLHSEDKQVKWAGERGWVTDKTALQRVVGSGAAKRILLQAIMARLR